MKAVVTILRRPTQTFFGKIILSRDFSEIARVEREIEQCASVGVYQRNTLVGVSPKVFIICFCFPVRNGGPRPTYRFPITRNLAHEISPFHLICLFSTFAQNTSKMYNYHDKS